ncbi:MAG: hypothetical protein OEY51_09825 [Cyclobacteriaceae bacterium]|nr:hypothetical protein [Cyclobacteriaceae bacterium]
MDEAIDQYLFEMPAMILQPFVENAIVHGLMPKSGNKKLTILFTALEDSVQCCVIDNGIGRDQAATRNSGKGKDHQSRGLEVTRQRLASHGGTRSRQQSIEIEDIVDSRGNPAGTRVCILIPNLNDSDS